MNSEETPSKPFISKAPEPCEFLVWADCEMTGLDISSDSLIEIAMIVTDAELNVIDDGIDIVIHETEEKMGTMKDVVKKMHAKSGLTTEVLNSTTSVADAEKQCIDYLKSHGIKGGSAPLCGNTISIDRRFLDKYMPNLEFFLHYRSIDVSSFKEICRRWYPEVYTNRPEKLGEHRALGDILGSIEEMRYYRQYLLA